LKAAGISQEADINSRELIAIIRAASADELQQLALRYGNDPRKGVQTALLSAERKHLLAQRESDRLDALYARLDTAADTSGIATTVSTQTTTTTTTTSVIVGIDEVGRGALAGPLMVAAVVLPARPRLEELDDSKRLTAKQRERLAARIREVATAFALARVEADEIDATGMAAALRKAMTSALTLLDLEPDLVLIDGNPLGIHPKELAIVGGDSLEAPIAAASVLAKVTRDAWMVENDATFPGYHLAANKGYASPAHISALQTKGPSDIHRKTFLTRVLHPQERLF